MNPQGSSTISNGVNEATPISIDKRARFRGQILKQVYKIWLFRKLLPILILEILLLSFFLYQLGKLIFLQQVIENALNVFFLNPPRLLNFLVAAFTNTSWGARVVGVMVAILIALVLRHITQGVLRLILVKENYFGKTDK